MLLHKPIKIKESNTTLMWKLNNDKSLQHLRKVHQPVTGSMFY